MNGAPVMVLDGIRRGRRGIVIDWKHTSNGYWIYVLFPNGAKHWHASSSLMFERIDR